MDHHANLLPWQRICHQRGAELRMIELDENGLLDWQATEGLFDKQTRLIALCHVSNVLGWITSAIRATRVNWVVQI